MSRWLVSTVAVAGLAGAACSGNPLAPRVSGTATFSATLDASATDVRADLSDLATVTVRVQSTRPPLPEGIQVRVDATAGSLRTPGGELARSVTATVNPLTGVATLEFLCATANMGALSPVNDASSRLTAQILAGGAVSDPIRATGNVTVRCNRVEDRSDIVLVAPESGEDNNPDRMLVTLGLKDFDESSPAGSVTIDKVNSGDPNSGRYSLAATGMDVTQLPLNVMPADGSASFYILYPGDGSVAAGPVGFSFKASFVNRLNAVISRDFSVRYAKAPNNASIAFIELVPAGGSTYVRPRGSTDPYTADLAAGSNSSDAISIRVEVRDRSGRPPPAGTRVTFECRAENDAENCKGFAGLSVFTPETGMQTGLAAAMVESTVEPASPTNPERGVASIVFTPRSTSTPDTLTISAKFSPINAGTVFVPEADSAKLFLVDNNTVNISVLLTPEAIDATQNAELRVSLRRGTSLLTDREVCVTLDANSFVRGTLSDQDDDSRTDSVMVSTGTGTAVVTVSPQSTLTRGPVTMTVTALDLAYDRTRDTTDAPCRTTDPSARSVQKTLAIDRDPILAALVFVSADPAIIGVAGSSIPSTSRVTFRVVDDENQPLPERQVTFELDDNGDAEAAVTPFDLTDASGIAEAFVSGGSQAATLIVRATAFRAGGESVTSSSSPIVVVADKPAWANIGISVDNTRVWANKAVMGLDDSFGGAGRPASVMKVGVQLSDRFSNRIQRAGGYALQFRAESGYIGQSATTDATGLAVMDYIAGLPFAADVNPTSAGLRELVAYRVSHLDAPQPVHRYANPEDGDITLLVATRGEESFQDVNGNGTYQLGEPFVDLPEPFLDKNNDGLRATCDAPLAALPVHRDPALKAMGIGTYCNPYFDGDDTPNDPLYPTAAECRQHWCPDWDPQWNCIDPASGVKTPERVPATGPITGGRVIMCPWWRYKDFETRALRLGGMTTTSLTYLGVTVQPGWYLRDGWVTFPGIHGLVLDDATPNSTTAANGMATLRYNNGGFTYRAPGDSAPGSVVMFDPAAPGMRVHEPITVSSSGGGSVHLLVDTEALRRVTLAGPMGSGPDIAVDLWVKPGDPRAPFSEFDRAQLRVVQTDQFIDGNRNGVWDDVNGRYDTDTLIWKNVVVTGFELPKNLAELRQAGGLADVRLPSPAARNKPAEATVAGLYLRNQSGFHAVPDSNDIIDHRDPTGSGDLLYVPSQTNTNLNGYFGFRTTLKRVQFAIMDDNGNPPCERDIVDTEPFYDAIISPAGDRENCSRVYQFDFELNQFFCSEDEGTVAATVGVFDPRSVGDLKFMSRIPFRVEPAAPEFASSYYYYYCGNADGGMGAPPVDAGP